MRTLSFNGSLWLPMWQTRREHTNRPMIMISGARNRSRGSEHVNQCPGFEPRRGDPFPSTIIIRIGFLSILVPGYWQPSLVAGSKPIRGTTWISCFASLQEWKMYTREIHHVNVSGNPTPPTRNPQASPIVPRLRTSSLQSVTPMSGGDQTIAIGISTTAQLDRTGPLGTYNL